jgi:8-oxo-dGTP pyrophosphatase MutT (NUDIX family)
MRAREFTQPQAAGCILRAADTGRYCLQQRSDSVSDPGVWSTWGGGREPGESLEQCVRRELAEEGGYTGPLQLEPLMMNQRYATYIGHVPHEFEPDINNEVKDWCWVEPIDLPSPLHPGLEQALSNISLNESTGSYKEIEFVCANPQFDDATNPELQKQMFIKLKQIPGVIPLWQDWCDYSEGQKSLTAIYKDRAARSKILSLAKQLGIEIDLEQPVSDDYVDRAIRGEHDGQITENFADGQSKKITFNTQKGKKKFATTMMVNNAPVGVYQYNADTGRSIAEIYPEYKGQGLGKLLILNAIYTAANLGLDFVEDESRTAEYDNVLDSLSSNGYIVDDDGYWYVTSQGEQYLKQSLKQGMAENFADGKVRGKSRPGRVKRSGASCAGSVTDLRARAKKYGGERGRMYHWCANMKSGKKK